MSSIFRRIFDLAEQLEPNRAAIWDWLWHTPIETLGGRTAIELAFAGDGERAPHHPQPGELGRELRSDRRDDDVRLAQSILASHRSRSAAPSGPTVEPSTRPSRSMNVIVGQTTTP